MSVSDADIAFALDLFRGLGPLSTRKMMGGLCLYSDGRIFAILSSGGRLYLKAAGALADDLAAEGSEIFAMTDRTGQRKSMGYWTLPDAALEDPELACDWARRALSAL